MNKIELIKRLKKINLMGFIPTKFPKNKNGGAGNTLEDLLGIKENNISLPDLGEIELKTTNGIAHKGRLISLFNFNKKVWKMNQLEAIKKYGSNNKDGRIGLYYTLNTTPNSAGLFVRVDREEEKIIVQHVNGDRLLEYFIDNLVSIFNKKVQSISLVYFNQEERDRKKYFKYYKVKFLTGGTTKENIMNHLENHIITIDLRLHPKKGKKNTMISRNHGTAFRIKEGNLQEIYSNIENVNL